MDENREKDKGKGKDNLPTSHTVKLMFLYSTIGKKEREVSEGSQ